mmetsp:Transcript_7002/g.25818  ORF Transcript_7002/g.25818 Transcript_7002/m.25818 type:complete len:699 (-) Transcript_7002:403-2499(-)
MAGQPIGRLESGDISAIDEELQTFASESSYATKADLLRRGQRRNLVRASQQQDQAQQTLASRRGADVAQVRVEPAVPQEVPHPSGPAVRFDEIHDDALFCQQQQQGDEKAPRERERFLLGTASLPKVLEHEQAQEIQRQLTIQTLGKESSIQGDSPGAQVHDEVCTDPMSTLEIATNATSMGEIKQVPNGDGEHTDDQFGTMVYESLHSPNTTTEIHQPFPRLRTLVSGRGLLHRMGGTAGNIVQSSRRHRKETQSGNYAQLGTRRRILQCLPCLCTRIRGHKNRSVVENISSLRSFHWGGVRIKMKGTELRAADGIGWLGRQSLWVVAVILLGLYTAAIGVFTFLYRLGGKACLNEVDTHLHTFFYFSVQTISTIGYGAIYPVSNYCNVLVFLEAIVGLSITGLMAGLIYSISIKPRPLIEFSEFGCLWKENDVDGWRIRFRLIVRSAWSVMINANVRVQHFELPRDAESHQYTQHRFKITDLEIDEPDSRPFLFTWNFTHEITSSSPLSQWPLGDDVDEKTFKEETRYQAITIALTCTDAGSGETITRVHQYNCSQDIIYGHKFADMGFIQDRRHHPYRVGKTPSPEPANGPFADEPEVEILIDSSRLNAAMYWKPRNVRLPDVDEDVDGFEEWNEDEPLDEPHEGLPKPHEDSIKSSTSVTRRQNAAGWVKRSGSEESSVHLGTLSNSGLMILDV